jgi:aminodeoxyfutalosine synthase
LQTLIDKLENNEILSFEDGVKLYDLDILTLGKYADKRRRDLYQNRSFFNINRHINPTNLCKDICKFCAFSSSRKNPNIYTMTIDEILNIARESVKNGAKELHIVSAHNNEIGLDWYFDMFVKIKEEFPNIHIKALTAAEIHFLSTEYNLSYDDIIDKMINSGVDSMPGGGAEIFDEKVREYICKGKVNSENWLKIHTLWHKRGKKSNATMLFGHIESKENRIEHMLRLREIQDKSGGFNAFIPLLYQKSNNYLNVKEFPTGQEILKTIAISRLLLHNIPHIKSYWVTSSINLALISQEFGADDLDGTIQKESINSAAGANSSNGLKIEEFVHLIKDSGFRAIERDSLYNEIKEW